MGEMGTYTDGKLGEDPIGGMLDIGGRVPDEVPAHWLVYFAVEDTDATRGAGQGLRRRASRFGPIDIPAGRFAIVTDPLGAVFAVIQTARGELQPLSRPAVAAACRARRARSPPLRSGRRSRPRPPIRRAGRGWRS